MARYRIETRPEGVGIRVTRCMGTSRNCSRPSRRAGRATAPALPTSREGRRHGDRGRRRRDLAPPEHVGEVAATGQDGIGAIWVVLADHDLDMVSQGMAAVTGDARYERYYELTWTDLAAIAEGLGAKNVRTVDEVSDTLQQAIDGARKKTPQVLVAAIDPTEKPPYKYAPPPLPRAR